MSNIKTNLAKKIMNLVKTADVNSTLWVEMTDVDSEIVFGGKVGKLKGKSVIVIRIDDSNVLIAGGNISFGDNAF